MAVMSSMYFWAYALVQPVGGILADSLGSRILISASTLICVVGSCVMIATHVFTLACIGRFFVGIGVALVYIPSLRLYTTWFSVSKFPFLASALAAVGGLGSTVATTPLLKWSQVMPLGWRGVFLVISGLQVLLVVFFFVVCRNRPQDLSFEDPNIRREKLRRIRQEKARAKAGTTHAAPAHGGSERDVVQDVEVAVAPAELDEETSEASGHSGSERIVPDTERDAPDVGCFTGFWAKLKHTMKLYPSIARSSQFWTLALWFTFLTGNYFTMSGHWITKLMEDAFGFDTGQASIVTLCLSISLIVAPIFHSLNANYLGRRAALIINTAIAVAVAALFLLAISAGASVAQMSAICFFMGFSYGSPVPIANTALKEDLPIEISGSALGLFNMCAFIASAVFQIVYGAIIKAGGYEELADGTVVYEQRGYILVLLFLTIMICVSFVLVLFSRETHPPILRSRFGRWALRAPAPVRVLALGPVRVPQEAEAPSAEP